MNQDLKYQIADNMRKYGGSFMKALSECILRADPHNLAKLLEAFPKYFKKYHPKNWKQ